MKKHIIITLAVILALSVGCTIIEDNDNDSKPKVTPETPSIFPHDFIGKDLQQTIETLDEIGIEYDVFEEYSEAYVKGFVISQSIAPGSEYEAGDKIDIKVSKGSEFLKLPSVLAMTKEEAVSVLEGKQLSCEIVKIHNNSMREGLVISQTPEPASRVKFGDTVTINVSLGTKKVRMADLLGYTEAYVKSFFSEINLEYTIEYEKSNMVEAGKVISQSARKDTLINEGEKVNILISSGLVEHEAGDYTGRYIDEVLDVLAGKCIVETIYDYALGFDDGDIISQSIVPGDPVTIESTMVLTVNDMDSQPVSFADENLELLVRNEISKHEGMLLYRDVKDILNLSNYGIDHGKIKDLHGIENLASLKSLYLFGEDIADITPLAELTELNHLNLECNDIEDVTSLGTLVKMKSIALSSNPISDISIFAGMKNLESAWLSGCPIDSISSIRGYTNFENLNISHTYVDPQEVVEIVSEFTKMRALQITGIEIGKLDFIKSFNTLKYLDIDFCNLDDIDGLENFPYLKSLKIYHNNIADISPIENLTYLESLWIGHNVIQDISALENLKNIDHLFISNIITTDFSILSNLTKLKNLYISDNNIDKLEFLRGLKNLEMLEIVSNILDDTNADEIINELRNRGCKVIGFE